MFCGVYARVVSRGRFRAGDALVRVSPAPTPLHGERDWPRTARVVACEDAGSRSTSLWIDDPLGRLAAAEPGQHVRVHLADEPAPAWRCYTISGVEDGRVRITVRRDGRISTALHDRLDVGSQLVVTGPFGDVTLDAAAERDLVLLSAGSGITPTVAMLRALVDAGAPRRVRVLHVERTVGDLALWDEVLAACAELPDARARLHLTRGDSSSRSSSPSAISATAGRPTAVDVVDTLDGLDPASVDVFVCGPALFTADVRTVLAGAGVPGDRVHAEVFYSPAIAALSEPRDPSTTGPHRIVAASTDVSWTPGSGSILDAVEGAGVDWPSGCRVGACGTCVRRLRRGTVEYLLDPIVPPPEGSVLVCCSAPTSDLELESAP
jgi:ferredoxin-NADP reductase